MQGYYDATSLSRREQLERLAKRAAARVRRRDEEVRPALHRAHEPVLAGALAFAHPAQPLHSAAVQSCRMPARPPTVERVYHRFDDRLSNTLVKEV